MSVVSDLEEGQVRALRPCRKATPVVALVGLANRDVWACHAVTS